MAGPRTPRPEEYKMVIEFMTSHLRQESSWSLAEEYPLVFNSQNINNIHFIEKDGQVLSGAALRTSLVKSPIGILKVAGVGSVVTDPAFREQGFSTQVLNSTLEAAKNAACDIAILWTHLHDFYRRIGFELAGSEVSVQIHQSFPIEAKGIRFSDSPKVSPDAILRLYSQHTCGTVRSIEDIRKSLLIPNTRVYTAWDQHNQLLAYAIEGKGADLAGHIHEWGGAVSRLLPLFNFIYEHNQQPFTLLLSAHSKNLLRQLSEKGFSSQEGLLGMIKIINHNLLFSKLHRYARNLGIDNFVLEKRGDFTHFGFGTEVFKTDSDSDIIKLIFGPLKAHELHQFDEETHLKLEKLFPIPFWIWGWDSV